uniref:HTH_48 domain-containing protein n=1 Tax=Caenorhabditis tropicalis TaxID=1561998 RepID=A0A1I7UV38_9PELO
MINNQKGRFHTYFDNIQTRHAALLYDFMLGRSAQEAHRNICQVIGYQNTHLKPVYNITNWTECTIRLEDVEEIFERFRENHMIPSVGNTYSYFGDRGFTKTSAETTFVKEVTVNISSKWIKISVKGDKCEDGIHEENVELPNTRIIKKSDRNDDNFEERAAKIFCDILKGRAYPLNAVSIRIETIHNIEETLKKFYKNLPTNMSNDQIIKTKHIRMTFPKLDRKDEHYLKKFFTRLDSDSLKTIKIRVTQVAAVKQLPELENTDQWKKQFV